MKLYEMFLGVDFDPDTRAEHLVRQVLELYPHHFKNIDKLKEDIEPFVLGVKPLDYTFSKQIRSDYTMRVLMNCIDSFVEYFQADSPHEAQMSYENFINELRILFKTYERKLDIHTSLVYVSQEEALKYMITDLYGEAVFEEEEE